ncbi:MAG: ATP-binding cassette domain-containing protein, partial [Haliea sp.]|nr:ATP-binding cassette domain-containing protein [Haliea sp.]
PMTALNPVHTIGRQLTEGMLLHGICTPSNALRAAADMLDRVGIPSPDLRLGEYPHQLSGGMRQRVVIAMALACAGRDHSGTNSGADWGIAKPHGHGSRHDHP